MGLALFFSLGAMLSFGIANAVIKTVAERCGAVISIIFRNIIIIILLGAALLVIAPKMHSPTWAQLFWAIALPIGGYFGLLFLLLGLEREKVGIVIPLSSFRIVIGALVGLLFLGEVVTEMKIISVALVFAGVVLASIDIQALRSGLSLGKGVMFGLLAGTFWGVFMTFFGFPSAVFGALLYALIIEVVTLVAAIAHAYGMYGRTLFSYTRSVFASLDRRSLIMLGISGVLGASATFFFNLALETGEYSLTSAVAGSSVVVSVITGAFLYGERLTLQQYAAIALVTTGILVPLSAFAL